MFFLYFSVLDMDFVAFGFHFFFIVENLVRLFLFKSSSCYFDSFFLFLLFVVC